MSKKAFTKKTMIFFISIILASVIGGFSYMVFCNSSNSYPVEKVSSTLINKIEKGSVTGTTLELNNKDLNAIIGMYFKGDKTFGNITVKGVHGDILENNIKLNIPIRYKGFNFMLTSEGKLKVKDKDIIYSPLYFKVGKITLPMASALEMLQKHLVKGVAIKDNNITLNKSIVPLEINSIEIKNNEVYIGLEKISGGIEKKLISGYKNLEDKLLVKSSGDIKDSSINNSNNGLNNSSSDNSNNKISSESSNNSSSGNNSKDKTSEIQNSSNREEALSRINGGLNAAMSSVSTGSQKAVIGQMLSVVNTMEGNQSYNPYSASGSIKASYKGLSTKEKAELKSAVFSNVDGDSINVVLSMLGM